MTCAAAAICEPLDCAMTVDEMGQGVVYLLEWEGM